MDIDLSKLKAQMNGGNHKEKQKDYSRYTGKEGSEKKKNHGHGGYGRGNYNDSYVGSPYNFVPLSKKVKKVDSLTNHDTVDPSLHTGEISYTVEAMTDIFISDGHKLSDGKTSDPYFTRDAYGRYTIPGSSIRGLIKENVQILGMSSMADDIDDYALMYRDVSPTREHKDMDDTYNEVLGAATKQINGKSVSILKNVRAGYIKKENGKYLIYPTVGLTTESGANYYYLSERTVINSYLNDGDKYAFNGLLDSTQNKLAHNAPEKLRGCKDIFKNASPGKKYPNWVNPYDERGNEQTDWKGNPKDVNRKDYQPVYFEAGYKAGGNTVYAVVEAGKDGSVPNGYKKGYVLLSGKMQSKKAIYIIPEIDSSVEAIEIPKKDIDAYAIDFNNKKNILGKNKDFFNLPSEREGYKPVFYIQLGEKLYFGFTPHLRLFYEHTIAEGIPSEQIDAGPDYAKSIFGFISNEGKSSYKSKVSFADASVIGVYTGKIEKKRMVLGEPKPTSYNDYLRTADGHAQTYNNDGFELRGAKQYWLHQDVEDAPFDPAKQDKVAATIRPLDKGVKFRGVIRFQNLNDDELGLLLWAIRLEENSQMNIGMAKSYGYGRIKVTVDDVKLFNPAKAYSLDDISASPWEEPDVDTILEKYIGIYKKDITAFLRRDVMKDSSVSTFFMMHDASNMPDSKYIRYMNIDKREYQNRRPLPDVEQVLAKKK